MNYRKSVAAFFCIIMCTLSSFALTSGPAQPDFSSFEPVDASDLVNLPTGDFAYPMPLGDVKTPDGVGYPVVLSYHAGIMNEQEATWVGLGWTLNVGAINRQIRMIPDDYNDAATTCYSFDPGESGWTFDIGGGYMAYSATIGFSGKAGGGVKFEGLTSVGVGFGIGVASVGITWTPNAVSIGVGVGAGSASMGAGISVATNSGKVAGSFNAGISNVAGFSMSTQGSVNVSVAGQSMPYHMAVNQAGFHQAASNHSLTIPLPYGFRLDLGWGNWNWHYSFAQNEFSMGYLYQGLAPHEGVNDPFLDYARQQRGPSGDMDKPWYQGIKKLEASKLGAFSFPSQDIYSLSGQGVSGQFTPFTNNPGIYCVSDKTDYDGLMGSVDYEPDDFSWDPYRYTDSHYTFKTSFNDRPADVTYDFNSGMTFKSLDETSLNYIDRMDILTQADKSKKPGTITYDGMNSYSNIGQIDGVDPVYTAGKRIAPIFGNYGQLEGFKITDQQGKSYYYTCPIYNYYQTTYLNSSATVPELGKNNPQYNFRRMTTPFATAWLLTAVTGPDYIRMMNTYTSWEEALMPHQGDWGYWVRFRYEYGLPIMEDATTHMPKLQDQESDDPSGPFVLDKAKYCYRMPYFDSHTEGELPHECDKCAKKKQYSSMFGIRDVTYLKSIETASEVAFFRTSERLDGFGIDNLPNLGHNLAQDNIGDPTTVYLGDPGSTNNSITVAPPAHTVTNLDQCMKITLPGATYPVSSFEGAQGSCILQIKYNRQCVYYKDPDWGLPCWMPVDCDDRTVDMQKVFYIIMDKFNCTYNEEGVPTSFSGDYPAGMFTDATEIKNDVSSGKTNIPAGKCIYVGQDGGGNTVLYVIGYEPSATPPAGSSPQTTLLTFDFDTWPSYGDEWWKVKYFNTAHFEGVDELGASVVPGVPQNEICKYVKKLDEIAWYSKANYPYLNGITDPEERYFKNKGQWGKDFPFPNSYKRVKFRYNYELAKNTPNSKSDGIKPLDWPPDQYTYSGGRLTLKEVYQQGGPEDAPVNMPSHMFSYQGLDITYNGYKGVDPWGMQKPSSASTVPLNQIGVNWNLSKILLPACGTMEINYERDRAQSSWCTVKQLYDYEQDKCPDADKIFEYPSTVTINSLVKPVQSSSAVTNANVKPYTNPMRITGYTAGSTALHLDNGDPLADITKLDKGMLILVYYEGTYGPQHFNETWYVYRIVDLDVDNKLVMIEKPLDLPSGYTPNIAIKGITKSVINCEGVRVTKLQTRSLSGIYSTTYSYPEDGIIETIPDIAIPKLFKDTLIIKSYNYYGGDQDIGVLYDIGTTHHSSGITVVPAGSSFKEDPTDAQKHGYNHYFYGAFDSIVDAEWVQFVFDNTSYNFIGADIYILYEYPDPIPGTAASRMITVDGSAVTSGPIVYSINFPLTDFPSTNDQKVGALFVTNVSLNAGDLAIKIEWNAGAGSQGRNLRIIGVDIRPIHNRNDIRGINPLYTTGNSSVTYPQIEVRQTTPDDKQPNGYTRYRYYTFDDLVDINGVKTAIMSSEIISGTDASTNPATNLKVWKIKDRTSIVGLCKQIEQVHVKSDLSERVVSKTVKEYALGDDLDRSGIHVLLDAATQVAANKPLGAIRERSIRLETPGTTSGLATYTTKTVADVIKYKPFLVRMSDTVDNVPKKTNYGLFDAFSGNALATLITGSAPSDTPRLTVTVPYRMLLDPSNTVQKTRLWELLQKNQYTLAGGSFLSDNVKNQVIPNTIAQLLVSHASDNNIRTAKCSMFKLDSVFPWLGSPELAPPGNFARVVFPQWRFSLNSENTWKSVEGDPFNWPTESANHWIKDRTIDSTDRYSRPLIELNALGKPYTLIYHPLMNAIVGKIDNARKSDCAVFTCDYEDLESVTGVYLDSLNGWQKGKVFTGGALEFAASPTHFGHKSLHVSNSMGPMIYLPYNSDIPYVFSAWVYPEAGTTYIRFTSRGVYYVPNLGVYYADGQIKDQVITGLMQKKWQLVNIKIPKFDPGGGAYIRFAIGNNDLDVSPRPNFYVDDIRIYPSTAHVSTFYYDPNLQLPITFVDENNNARYVKYDEFGRTIEKGRIKEE